MERRISINICKRLNAGLCQKLLAGANSFLNDKIFDLIATGQNVSVYNMQCLTEPAIDFTFDKIAFSYK